jgi:CubicO group peptidase (beta-lactamase class C family)
MFGTMLGEVVRRVTGRTLGAWFAEHVAGPLGLEFWIGLPASLDDRVVPSVWDEGPADEPDSPAPGSYAARRREAMAKLPPMDPDPHDAASRRAYYGLEVPAAHGVTNARSLARMYAALDDDVDGTRLLSPGMLEAATTPQTDGLPALIESGTAGPDIRFGLGYQLASPSMPGLSPASFGHTGAGGRLGIADPGLGIAFGYVCNSMRGIGPGGDPRWSTLLDAVARCV